VVLATVLLKFQIFLDVTPYRLAVVTDISEGRNAFFFSSLAFLPQNVGDYLRVETVSHPRRPEILSVTDTV
jgi:hypothetical protein